MVGTDFFDFLLDIASLGAPQTRHLFFYRINKEKSKVLFTFQNFFPSPSFAQLDADRKQKIAFYSEKNYLIKRSERKKLFNYFI